MKAVFPFKEEIRGKYRTFQGYSKNIYSLFLFFRGVSVDFYGNFCYDNGKTERMMDMEKLLLIVNPCAGQRRAKRELADIVDVFNRGGFTVLTYITAGRGDAESACIRYADQVDRIVCCGGDGTFNETVSGVLKSGRQIPIGYIPAGSTNDFATSLNLSTTPRQAAADIVAGSPVKLDIGLFGQRYFSYVASFGAFTRTSYTTPQNLKNLLGHAAYVLSGIQELSQLHACPLQVTLSDGQVIEDKFIFGAISNSTSVGGILSLSPELVDMADGKFELLLIRVPKDLFELHSCVRALQQPGYSSPLLTLLSTDRLTIRAPEDMPWTLDGEQADGHAVVEVSCLHHAISVYTKTK